MKYAIAILALLVTSPAWADCKRSDIKGNYLIYFDRGQQSGVCAVTLNKRGVVRGGGCAEGTPFIGGRLRLARNCTLEGELQVPAGFIAVLGSLERSRDAMAGVWGAPSDNLTFNAIRHSKRVGPRWLFDEAADLAADGGASPLDLLSP